MLLDELWGCDSLRRDVLSISVPSLQPHTTPRTIALRSAAHRVGGGGERVTLRHSSPDWFFISALFYSTNRQLVPPRRETLENCLPGNDVRREYSYSNSSFLSDHESKIPKWTWQIIPILESSASCREPFWVSTSSEFGASWGKRRALKPCDDGLLLSVGESLFGDDACCLQTIWRISQRESPGELRPQGVGEMDGELTELLFVGLSTIEILRRSGVSTQKGKSRELQHLSVTVKKSCEGLTRENRSRSVNTSGVCVSCSTNPSAVSCGQ